MSEAVPQAGYSQDKPHILTPKQVLPNCWGLEKLGLMFHDCDAVKGDSGAPIVAQIAGKYEFVGVHVATRKQGRPAVGIAVSVFNVTKLSP